MAAPCPSCDRRTLLSSTAPLFAAALRKHGRLVFVLADEGALRGCHGKVNLASAVVLLDAANSDGEMRATLAHELQHLLNPGASEDEVEAATAQQLVPLEAAMHAAASGDFAAVAEDLLVDEALVRARLRPDARRVVRRIAG